MRIITRLTDQFPENDDGVMHFQAPLPWLLMIARPSWANLYNAALL